MTSSESSTPLRPRDLALLLLASGDLRPRQRARDQQADHAGLALKRRMLDRLAALDPEATEIDACLQRMVEEFGPPHGPTRAIASSIRDDWLDACTSSAWLQKLLEEATRSSGGNPP